MCFFFFSSRRRHTRSLRDWSSDVCSSDLLAAQAPGTPIDELSLADDEERAALHAVAHPPAVQFPDRCLHELVQDQVRRTPDATALAWPGGTLTYQELDDWADRVAALVQDAGGRPDDIVGVLVDRSPAMV